MTDRTHFDRRAVLGCLLAPLAGPAWSQTFPSRPIRIVVGFPPGAAPDVVTRIVAQRLQESLGGNPVVVDNRAGAGGLLATQELLRSPADGYTIMLCGVNQVSIAMHAYRKLPYDPNKDLLPIASVTDVELVLVSGTQGQGAKSAAEFTAQAAKKDPFFIATVGAGTMSHFSAAIYADSYKLKTDLVHYKNVSDALTGLVSGDVHAFFASPAFAAPQVKAGKLRAYATTGTARLASLPEVPTFKELGKPEMEISTWFALFAKAGTPPDIVERLGTLIAKDVKAKETRTKLEEAGFHVTGLAGKEFAAFVAQENQRWGRIVAATGFKADE